MDANKSVPVRIALPSTLQRYTQFPCCVKACSLYVEADLGDGAAEVDLKVRGHLRLASLSGPGAFSRQGFPGGKLWCGYPGAVSRCPALIASHHPNQTISRLRRPGMAHSAWSVHPAITPVPPLPLSTPHILRVALLLTPDLLHSATPFFLLPAFPNTGMNSSSPSMPGFPSQRRGSRPSPPRKGHLLCPTPRSAWLGLPLLASLPPAGLPASPAFDAGVLRPLGESFPAAAPGNCEPSAVTRLVAGWAAAVILRAPLRMAQPCEGSPGGGGRRGQGLGAQVMQRQSLAGYQVLCGPQVLRRPRSRPSEPSCKRQRAPKFYNNVQLSPLCRCKMTANVPDRQALHYKSACKR